MNAMTREDAIGLLLGERAYQDGHAPDAHSRADLILLIEHYITRARTDLLCPQMPTGAEESSIRKVGALALRFIEEHGAPERSREAGDRDSIKVGASKVEVLRVLRGLLQYHDDNTCIHEDTHRGGAIWTICSGCERKWADDRGGFVPYSDPPAVAAARALLGVDPLVENDPAHPIHPRIAAMAGVSPEDQHRALASLVDDSAPPSGADEAVALRQARFVLRDLHAKDPNCGYGKLADACERAADRAVSDG